MGSADDARHYRTYCFQEIKFAPVTEIPFKTISFILFAGSQSYVSRSHVSDERSCYGYQRHSFVFKCTIDWRTVRRLGKKILSADNGFLHMRTNTIDDDKHVVVLCNDLN